MSQQIETLICSILARQRDFDRPFVVAIDGRSGAGKSTLAQTIARRLDAQLISGDDFFAGGEEVLDEAVEVLARNCVDWRAQRAVLERLHLSESTSFHPYDWDAFDGSKSLEVTHVEPRRTVVLEGVYSARTELRDLLDLTVLIEVPDTKRLKRLIGREGELSAWEQQWHRAEDWYFENVAPPRSFDVLLSDVASSPSS